MRLTFVILIMFSILIRTKTIDSHEFQQPIRFVDTPLDLRGSYRRKFLVKALYENQSIKSIAFSPFISLMPLGKLALGATGDTEKVLLEGLGLESRNQIRSLFSHLVRKMQFLPGVTLDLATNVFINTQNNFNKKFLRQTQHVFRSACATFDASNPANAAKIINQWVWDNTNKRIGSLVNSWDFHKYSSAVLVGGMYFHGKWKNKFTRIFFDYFDAPNRQSMTPMMTRRGLYEYCVCNDLDAQIVEIPYEGDKASMILVVPKQSRGLPDLLKMLDGNPDLLNICLEEMNTTHMQLIMPKFMIKSDVLNVTDVYEKIGFKTILDMRNTGLPNIIENELIYVGTARQKIILEVNEKGSDGAGDVMPPSPGEELRLYAKIPFLFIIKAYQEQLIVGCFQGS